MTYTKPQQKYPLANQKITGLDAGFKDTREPSADESFYWIKHFSFRLAVINLYLMLMTSELLLSTHLPTSEGWTAELVFGLWLVVPTKGFEPTTRVDLTRSKTLRLNHSNHQVN